MIDDTTDDDTVIEKLETSEALLELLSQFRENLSRAPEKSFRTQISENLTTPLSPLRAAWKIAAGVAGIIPAYARFHLNQNEETLQNFADAYVRLISKLIPALIMSHGETAVLNALPEKLGDVEMIDHIRQIKGVEDILQLCRKKAFQPPAPQSPAPQ